MSSTIVVFPPLAQIRVCSVLCELRMLTLDTTSSAARERTIHYVRGSRKRKLEHVQPRLNTRACLTQTPATRCGYSRN